MLNNPNAKTFVVAGRQHGKTATAARAATKRVISVQELLTWAFVVEHAQLGNPAEVMPEPSGAGMEWRLMQQAQLGCRVDGGGWSAAHDDAELVASVVSALPLALGGKAMALRVVELARAGRSPDWCENERPRCIPRAWTHNRYGDHAATAVVEKIKQTVRGRVVEVEVRCCPVTFAPSAAHISAKRRDYLGWYGALLDIATNLRQWDLKAHVLNDVMPPMAPWQKKI